MDPSPPSWPTRLLRALPPIPDGVQLGFLVLMLLMLGFLIGHTVCLLQHVPKVQRLTVQQQLDVLDKRLKALEQR